MTTVHLNILDMSAFLTVLHDCEGDVIIHLPTGGCLSTCYSADYESQIFAHYSQAKKYLPLTLEISNAKDHMAIVCYYSGDC